MHKNNKNPTASTNAYNVYKSVQNRLDLRYLHVKPVRKIIIMMFSNSNHFNFKNNHIHSYNSNYQNKQKNKYLNNKIN